MVEQVFAISKYEVAWITWEHLCVKFGYDPLTTKNILLYVNRAESVKCS